MKRTMHRLLLLTVVMACQARSERPAVATFNAPVPAEALTAIDTGTLMRHIRVLSADSLLGRAPGTIGEDRTIAYLEHEFSSMGLAPGNPDGTYIQKVPLVGITVQGTPSLTFTKGSKTTTLAWRDDYVAWTKHVAEQAALDKSALVFVGYGVEAPEFQWDDFKGVDVTGKTLVMLVNDPPLDDTKIGRASCRERVYVLV